MDEESSAALAEGLFRIADALNRLGNNGALTESGAEMGGMEAHAVALSKAIDHNADEIANFTEVFREFVDETHRIANALLEINQTMKDNG